MVNKILNEIKVQTKTLIVAALGFVAALVWKDAIIAWLTPLMQNGSGATALTVTAIVVTIVAVVLTIIIAKVFGDTDK